MDLRTLTSAEDLATLLQQRPGQVVIFDCRFDLANPAAGRAAYAAGHLPGALYLHLDEDLSGAKTGLNGRHPLPDREAFAQRLAALGVGPDDAVVVYDAAGGMIAARAWWMLRWIGHQAVAVLDGGWPAWLASGGAVETGTPAPRPPARLSLQPSLVGTVDRDALLANLHPPARPVADLHPPARLVVDARSPDRFRGENETLDPVGGRIPGSRNRSFRDNLGADGRFKPAAQLREEFAAITGGRPVADLVMSCGSGVTACHNLLALEIAGQPGALLYPGSWSEWCAWPGAPVATGA